MTICHPEQSEGSASAFVLAFLVCYFSKDSALSPIQERQRSDSSIVDITNHLPNRYTPDMPELAVTIVRFVDECQPGIVACEFTDSDGHAHIVIDKVPMFTSEPLWHDSNYPTTGTARCSVIKRWQDTQNRKLAQITISKPDSLETSDGGTEFIVLKSQLVVD